jgi:hypothetical protein
MNLKRNGISDLVRKKVIATPTQSTKIKNSLMVVSNDFECVLRRATCDPSTPPPGLSREDESRQSYCFVPGWSLFHKRS